MTFPDYQPMVEVTRGNIVESLHYGAAAVVDASGRLLASHGDPQIVTFLRSSSKPIQILPFLEAGGAEHFHLTDEEVALLCASHTGTDAHVTVARAIQKKVGVSEADLLCGIHPPSDKSTALAMLRRGEDPTPIRHNCSGKHSGMLAFCRLMGFPVEDYINPQHPVQKIILKGFADMCDLSVDDVKLGIDGCSVPVFAVPLRNAALAFARLCDPQDMPSARTRACRQVTAAMSAHPVMVSGSGHFDTSLMELMPGFLISKGGAEGYQSVGLLPGVLGKGSSGVGIAIKIADGDEDRRAGPLAALEILRQLDAISSEQLAQLARFYIRPVHNWRKLEVGEIRPCFTLQS
jgi:L-asparaginase II